MRPGRPDSLGSAGPLASSRVDNSWRIDRVFRSIPEVSPGKEVWSMLTRRLSGHPMAEERGNRAVTCSFLLLAMVLSGTVAAQDSTVRPPDGGSDSPTPKSTVDLARPLPDVQPIPDDSFLKKTQAKDGPDLSAASRNQVLDFSGSTSDGTPNFDVSALPDPSVSHDGWTFEPRNLSRYFTYAESHKKLGNFGRAFDYYEAAIRCDPKSIPARLGRAALRAELGYLRGAENDLDEILREQPGHAAARGLRYYIRVNRTPQNDRSALKAILAEIDDFLKSEPMEPTAPPGSRSDRDPFGAIP